MEDHCSIADLREIISGGSTHFRQSIFPQVVPQLFPGHRSVEQSGEDLMTMAGSHLIADMMPELNYEYGAATAAATTHIGTAGTGATNLSSGFEVETVCDGTASGRWPRQETLILLEIRSQLHHEFREANQKGPLWDEVSRIMSEEHGYQRSGKKCREKFENLYKYYKKTKEGKNGRQNGKHYRFFRQLDALCGETKNAVSLSQAQRLETSTHHLHKNGVLSYQKANQETFSLNISDCSEFNSISSDENGVCPGKHVDIDVSGEKRRKRGGRRRSWGEKIKECIDLQMRKMMEKQEVWLEKLMKTLEQKERDRMAREEEWRKQEARRIEIEHRNWAKERQCTEARDAALMATLQKFTGREPENSSPTAGNGGEDDGFEEYRKPNQIHEKRKEAPSLIRNVDGYCPYVRGGAYNAAISNGGQGESSRRQANDDYSPSSSIDGVQNSCFEFLMNGGETLWDNHGLKLN